MSSQLVSFPTRRSWVVMPLRALACSFTFALLSITVVGTLFEFFLGGCFPTDYHTSIVYCAPTGRNDRAAILSRTVSGAEQPTRFHLWLFDPARAQLPIRLPWSHSKASCVACLPNTDQIVIGGWDGSIHVAGLIDPDRSPSLLGRHSDGTISLQCSADGRYLVSRSHASLQAWDLASQKLLWQQAARELTCHAIDPRSARVLAGKYDGSLQEWELRSGAPVRDVLPQPYGHVGDLKFHADGRLLLAAGRSSGVFPGELHLLPWPPAANGPTSDSSPWRCSWIRRSAFSPDFTYLVTTSELCDSWLDVWDVHSRERVATLRGHRQFVLGAIFSSARRLLSWSADGTLCIWDIPEAQLRDVVTLPAG
jgi:WD40 repeat protein